MKLRMLLPLALLCGSVAVRAAQAWLDVTSLYITNASFDNNTDVGWTVTNGARTHQLKYGCTEFWYGTFDCSQTLDGLPDGKYRLRVNAFYRTQGNEAAYSSYTGGTENITAFLYAGAEQVKLASVYSQSFSTNLQNDCWAQGNWWMGYTYYPNGMASAQAAFGQGYYENVLEFTAAGGTVTIGIRNTTSRSSNWCIFDNFRLEYYGEVADATAASVVINEIQAANIDMFVSPSTNFDGWVELYNPTDVPVMLGGCHLSDEAANLVKWRMPETMGIIPAHGFRTVWFDHEEDAPLQAPFKLDTDGGTLYLSDAHGAPIALQAYPAAIGRTSYARTADGGGAWQTTAMPTPGYSNQSSRFASRQVETPVVSQPSQIFTGVLSVTVGIPEGATLRYTTDGTTPTLANGTTSTTGTFTVASTTNFRFRLFRDGELPSEVVTCSYLKKQYDFTLPVISVVTAPDFLYGDSLGVMVAGVNGKPGHGVSTPCNWNMDWERPVSFTYLSAGGQQLFQQDVLLEMCGGWSRAWEPHSFKLKGNKVMGTPKTLNYPFFSQKPYIRNRTLQIRNGGNDNTCRIKDAALETIIQRSGIDLDVQSYQPVVHYLNGKYIGVINMREPNNKHYVFANYGWGDDEIDQFEMDPDSGYVQKCGTEESLLRWYELSKKASETSAYEEICQMVDIDEYANYMAALLYLGTTDWPQNNLKGFYRREGGRWRFVSFDLDFAFNTSDAFNTFAGKQTYTFDYLYNTGGRRTQEVRMVTIFLNMMKNEDFRRRFIDAYCLMGGSVFESATVQAVIDELVARVKPMMALTGELPDATATAMKKSLASWNATMMKTLKNYSPMRLGSVTAQTAKLSADTQGARLFVNGQHVPYDKFSGTLFAPVTLRAEAPAGYRFVGWKTEGGLSTYSAEPEITMPTGNFSLYASFAPLPPEEKARQGIHDVMINEVSAANDTYVNDYFKRNDWVELYNTTSADIDVEGMYLSDDEKNLRKYQLRGGSQGASTVIPAGGHLVVWCDKLEPMTQLHASFKLGAEGGGVYLTAQDGSWTDAFLYPAHTADQTVGRYPDGGRQKYVMNVPTIGKANLYTSYLASATVTGVTEIRADGNNTQESRFNVAGMSIAAPERGLNIIRTPDGKTRKVMVE